MGIEKLIPTASEGEGIWSIHVPWMPNRAYTEMERIIIDEAINCGLTTPLPPAVGIVWMIGVIKKDKEGFISIAIGREPTIHDAYTASCVVYPGDFFKGETRPFVGAQLCHILFLAPNNPLELHWREQQGHQTISIEGIEKLEKISDATKHTKDLCRLLQGIADLFASGRGRPTDLDYSKRITVEAEKLRKSTKPRMPWPKVAEKLYMSESNLRYHRDQVKKARRIQNN